eukprot:CAMPEP_0169083470 /NCGR_PEP_ID=MMETSP1015-20121227/12096_1 /TAXON_ID=342587 /ORGANISM="Karlodinium micrum, Strain CCMP2283" /LENGTH=606 /DNA_ID=CAMNT_0009143397 /DNA_START=35 /DNA_END=1856 /DNA_ORIENTATION=+
MEEATKVETEITLPSKDFGSADLQKELHRFAKEVLDGQFLTFVEQIRRNTREDLKEFLKSVEAEETEEIHVNTKKDVTSFVELGSKLDGNELDKPRMVERQSPRQSTSLPTLQDAARADESEPTRRPSVGQCVSDYQKENRAQNLLEHRKMFRGRQLCGQILMSPGGKKREVSGSSKAMSAFHVKHDQLLIGGRDEKRGFVSNKLRPIVASYYFDVTVSIVIVLNGFYIGYSTDYMAKHVLKDTPTGFEVIEASFLFVFVMEVTLRFCVLGMDLFRREVGGVKNDQRNWNIFDFLVIGSQVLEFSFRHFKIDAEFLSRFSILRTLRLFRLIRIVRLVKVIRFISDLAQLLCLCIGVQTCLDRRVEPGLTPEADEELKERFGSVYVGMYTLYLTISGGVDWGDVKGALDNVHSWLLGELVLIFYIAFVTMALMNVIIGVFLERAMDMAKQEHEAFLCGGLFIAADFDQSGAMTYADFKRALDYVGVQDFFDAVDLEASEAKVLFTLLDASNDGQITAEEFLKGCLRLRGPAKSLDLLKLSRQVMMRMDAQDKHIKYYMEKNRHAIYENRHHIQWKKQAGIVKFDPAKYESKEDEPLSPKCNLPGALF